MSAPRAIARELLRFAQQAGRTAESLTGERAKVWSRIRADMIAGSATIRELELENQRLRLLLDEAEIELDNLVELILEEDDGGSTGEAA